MSARCRRPWAICHATEASAWAAVRMLQARVVGGPGLRAVRCGDHWHTGRPAVPLRRRIRTALSRVALRRTA